MEALAVDDGAGEAVLGDPPPGTSRAATRATPTATTARAPTRMGKRRLPPRIGRSGSSEVLR